MGGGGVKNYHLSRDVIYERPPIGVPFTLGPVFWHLEYCEWIWIPNKLLMDPKIFIMRLFIYYTPLLI